MKISNLFLLFLLVTSIFNSARVCSEASHLAQDEFYTFNYVDSIYIIDITKIDTVLVETIDTNPTPKKVYDFIVEIGIKHPDVVIKQCLFETGHLTSNLCKNNNNLFGMRPAWTRQSTAINYKTKDRWAKYESWKDSVIDYKMYQDYIMRNIKYDFQSDKSYWKYLRKCKYFLKDSYIAKASRVDISSITNS